MTTAAGATADVAILLKEARKNGYKTVPGGGGHKKLVDKHGRPVVDSNGPLIISSSPSDARWRVMTVKRWMAAGVLKSDPFDSNPDKKAVRGGKELTGGAASNRLTDPDVKEAKVAAIKARFAAHRQLSQKIREDFEPIIVKLGGWDKHGLKQQIGEVIFWFNEWRGHVEHFPSVNAAASALANLRKGNALNDNSRTAIGYFVDELKKEKDPAARYFELLRLSKGLPAREEETVRGGEPLSDPPTKEEREAAAAAGKTRGKVETPDATNGSRPATKPGALALEAVAFMVMGKDKDEVDMDRVLKLGEEIQQMELSQRGLA